METDAAERRLDEYLVELGEPTDAEPASPDLVRRAAAGDVAAREEVIERFLPLILALARRYRVDGLELADLAQEGCVGLLRALARFDPTVGAPFGAYATWWVRQAMQEARSDFVRPYRIPPKALRQLARLKSEHDRIYAFESRSPTVQELAERAGLNLRQAEALVRADARVRSLSEPLEDVDGHIGALGDLLEDPLSGAAFEEVLDAIEGERLRLLVGRLSDRERQILAARLGLDGAEALPLAKIGERYGVSAERVRQLEERALAKLRQGAEPPVGSA